MARIGRQLLVRKLIKLARHVIFGTLSESYRTCGYPNCRCQKGEKHGPHLYLSFHGPEGKTTGHYVPKDLSETTRTGIAAWHEAQDILRQLADLNREELWDARAAAKKAKQ
jgi:hypothetical protein